MQTSQLGAYHELIACSYFIQQGYEVFRNVAPSGPADLVAWLPSTGETIFVDVKTATKYVKADGSISYNWHKSSMKEGIKYLLMYDGEVLGFAEEIIAL